MNERRIERTKRFLDSVREEIAKQDARAHAAGLLAPASRQRSLEPRLHVPGGLRA